MTAQQQGSVEAEGDVPVVPAEAELNELACRWLQAGVERDADFVLAHSVVSPEAAFATIGTALSPFSLEGFAQHLRELKKVAWGGMSLTGYRQGTAAWFYGMEHGVLPWGQELLIRISLMMIYTGGAWKVCHCHISESVEREGIALD